MHEYSLVKSLLAQVRALQQKCEADRVVSIQVSVGEFSGVEPELFRSAYEMLIDASPLQGTELQMRRVSLVCRCNTCKNEFAISGFRFVCPECGGNDVTVLRGEDLVLESVTLETDDE